MKANLQIGQTCLPINGKLYTKPDYDKPVIIDELPKQEYDHRRYGIPLRYKDITMEYIVKKGIPPQVQNNVRDVQAYIANLRENLNEGVGMVFRGTVGTMKTTLAVAIMRATIELGKNAYFIPMANLMDKLFSGTTEERAKLEQRLQSVSLLVIDDLGMEYEKGWVTAKIRAIINDRYNEKKSTIITTNLGKDISDRYIEGMLDRIAGTSTFSNFEGKSLRKLGD